MTTPLQRARQTDSRRLSQLEVAEAVGLTQSYYSKIERAECQAKPVVAEKLSTFFGRRVSEIEILYPERFTTEPSTPRGQEPESESAHE